MDRLFSTCVSPHIELLLSPFFLQPWLNTHILIMPDSTQLKESGREGSALGVGKGTVLGSGYKLGAVGDRGSWRDRLSGAEYLW